MTVFRIRIEGPAALAVRLATELADADGIELISSEKPSILGGTTVLEVSVDGARADVVAAVSSVGEGLPDGGSIRIVDE